MVKRTILTYLFFTLISKFAISFIAATYVVFLMSHGLDIFQVGVVNATFYATLLVCEIPTGAFADIFGRKKSCALSYFLLALSMFVYGASTSFTGFVIAEIFGAIGGTFANGAFDAWLKDKLDFHGFENNKMKSVFARKSQISQLASGFGALVGAYLGTIDLRLPWIAGGVIFLLGGIAVILLLKEEYFERKSVSLKDSVLFTKNALRVGFKNKVIRFVAAMTLVQIITLQAPNMQWQPFFMSYGIEKSDLGYIYFGVSVAIVVGSFLSSWLLHRLKKDEKKFLAVSQIFMAAGMIVCCIPNLFVLSVFALLFHEFARGLFAPIKDDYINQSIPEKSKERATLLSIESIFHHIGGVIGLIASGFIAKHLLIPNTWLIFGGFLVIATLLIFRNGKK